MTKKILAIDDSPIVLRSIKSVLTGEYDVILADDGETGLHKAKECRPDLILLDYEMPDIDGKEVFTTLKLDFRTENIPVIFLTGVSEREKVEEIVILHPAGYVLKPIDAVQLKKKIRIALSHCR